MPGWRRSSRARRQQGEDKSTTARPGIVIGKRRAGRDLEKEVQALSPTRCSSTSEVRKRATRQLVGKTVRPSSNVGGLTAAP